MRMFTRGRDYQMAIDAAAEASDVLTFAVDQASIDPAVFGLTDYATTPGRAAKIDRATAMQVPAVKRVRDIVCPSAAGLPLTMRGPQGHDLTDGWALFKQPEPGRGRSITMTRLFEDLMFEEVAWWRVLGLNEWGFPGPIERLAPGRVQVDNDKARIYVDGREVTGKDRADLIRFDSPNDGLLTAGARAIRTCLLLDVAAARHADGTPPLDYFTPKADVDPGDDDAIIAMLNAWHARRQSGYTGYVPSPLDYHIGGWSPEQLQLADARQHAVLEIARCAGVDPEELGVSTTSRTYANQWERRKAFLDFTLGPYLTAVEDRLNMPDITPEGFTTKFDLDGFLRSDTKSRYETYKIGLEVGAIDPNGEVRGLEGKPPLAAPPAPALNAPEDPAS